MPDYSDTQGEEVKPLSAFYSTSLSPRVTSYDELATRIAYALGYPLVNIEAHTNTVYDNISVACEMYAKFAGYTEEYLVFDSNLYEPGKGVRMDKLFSITPDLSACYDTSKRELATDCCPTETPQITGYDVTCSVELTSSEGIPITGSATTCVTGTTGDTLSSEVSSMLEKQLNDLTSGTFSFTLTSESTTGTSLTGTPLTSASVTADTLTSTSTTGTTALSSDTITLTGVDGSIVTCITSVTAEPLTSNTGTLSTCVTSVTAEDDIPQTTTTPCTANQCLYNVSYDYDLNDYRKVIDVWSFSQGTHTGVNTLFTLEQTLAQQTYFSYAMGNYGFDLVSWYAVKEFLELREKLLCTRPSIHFNERTQYLQLIPAPRSRYYGIVACYVELPVKDLVKTQWVYKYALALTKMVVGRVRGKYGNTNLIGGGNVDGESLLSEGKEEREALEAQLYEGAPGLGDSPPPQFFVA